MVTVTRRPLTPCITRNPCPLLAAVVSPRSSPAASMLSFGPDPGKAAWIVAGDLNDYLPSTGLPPLLGQPWLENIVERIADPNDRWTHHWDDGDEYTQLDNLLLSRALA